MVEKWDKAGNVSISCLNKECNHREEVKREEAAVEG